MKQEPVRYFGNVLSSFENGVQMDLRVKLAIEFLKSTPRLVETAKVFFDHNSYNPVSPSRAAALFALNMADDLLEVAAGRGLLAPLPDDDSLDPALRQHIVRNVRAQVVQQVEGQRVALEEAPRVTSISPFVGGRQ